MKNSKRKGQESRKMMTQFRAFLGHVWALTWKNHVLKMRNPGIIIAEVVYPIINLIILPA